MQVNLGKPYSIPKIDNTESLQEYKLLLENIFKAKLAPWKNLEAVRDFFYTSLGFTLWNNFKKKELKILDSTAKNLLKDTYFHRKMGPPVYLHGDRSGCLGLPLLANDSDAAAIDGAFKLLTSRDHYVRKMAREDLTQIVKHRIERDPDKTDMNTTSYLHNEFK